MSIKLQREVDFRCSCSMRKTYMFYCEPHRQQIYNNIMKNSVYKPNTARGFKNEV